MALGHQKFGLAANSSHLGVFSFLHHPCIPLFYFSGPPAIKHLG